MDCARARSLLHPWLDGELEREDHRAVVEHLTRCEQCDARFKDEQRLLGRVKEGLAARCPSELRVKLLAGIAGAPLPAARSGGGAVITFRRAAAAAAVLAVAFVWSDPICLRGCPTVRALVQEHAAAPAIVTTCSQTARQHAERILGETLPECGGLCDCTCVGLECFGVKPVACSKQGCMIYYRDRDGRSICFVKIKADEARAQLHPWLRFRADSDGLISTRQDGCRFLGWRDGDGDTCGLVADESVGAAELLSICEKARGRY